MNIQTMEVQLSCGQCAPCIEVPPGATDSHHHIFDPRFPEKTGVHKLPEGYKTKPANVDAYTRIKQRLGIERSVVVAPSNYGSDNTCLLDALQHLGQVQARGIAIVQADVSDVELRRLHEGGVRGLRYYLASDTAPTVADLTTMGDRIADLGWHVQLTGHRQFEVIAGWEQTLQKLSCPIVLDHFAYAPHPGAAVSKTATTVRRLLASGNTYVKLSGVYIQSKVGHPSYSDVDGLACELAALAPERILWGTDWPHVGSLQHTPDAAELLQRLAVWAPDERVRYQILVENPTRLYWNG